MNSKAFISLSYLYTLFFTFPSAKGASPQTNKNFQFEIITSLIAYTTTVSDELNIAKGAGQAKPTLGGRILYNFNKTHYISTGLDYYIYSPYVSYPNEGEYEKGKPWRNVESSADLSVLSLPISYIIEKKLSKKTISFFEGGLALTVPIESILGGHVTFGDINTEDIDIISYQPKTFTGSIFSRIGVKMPVNPYNAIKFGAVINIPLHKNKVADFELYPNNPETTSAGYISTGYGYYGVSISYLFSFKKKHETIPQP